MSELVGHHLRMVDSAGLDHEDIGGTESAGEREQRKCRRDDAGLRQISVRRSLHMNSLGLAVDILMLCDLRAVGIAAHGLEHHDVMALEVGGVDSDGNLDVEFRRGGGEGDDAVAQDLVGADALRKCDLSGRAILFLGLIGRGAGIRLILSVV